MREDLYYPLFDIPTEEREETIIVFSATGAMRRLETMGLLSKERFAEWLDENVMPHSLAIRIQSGDAKEFLGELYTEFSNEMFETYFSKIEVWD